MAEASCPWIREPGQRIARYNLYFLADRSRKDPYLTGNLVRAEIGEICDTPTLPGPPAFLGRRWGRLVTPRLHALDIANVPADLLGRHVVVHTYLSPPVEVDCDGVAMARMQQHLVTACSLPAGALLRLPTYCPVSARHPLHVFLTTCQDSGASVLDYWGLFDMRAVVAPPRVPWFVLPLPAILDNAWLVERIVMHFPEVERQLAIYMNECLVQTFVSPEGRVPLFTVLDRRATAGGHQQLPPPVVDTTTLIDRWFWGGAVAPTPIGRVTATAQCATGHIPPPARASTSNRFPLAVPTHLDSHTATAGPASCLGCSFELIGHLRHAVEFRPRGPLTPAMLCQQAIDDLDLREPCTMHIPTLCPSTPRESPFVVLLPARRDRDDRYVLVDARLVSRPPQSLFWVQRVTQTLSPISVIAALRRAQPSLLTMGLIFLDSRPIRAHTEVGSHVPLLTILPESFAWDALPSPLHGRGLASRRVGLPSLPGRHDGIGQPDVAEQDTTSTTTAVGLLYVACPSTTTSTTVAPGSPSACRGAVAQHLDDKPIRFFVSSPSGRVEALTLTGDLPVTDVMAQLCWQLHQASAFQYGVAFKACDRAFSDVDLGFSVFCATYSPTAGEHAWIDADPACHYPFTVRLPFLLTTDSLADLVTAFSNVGTCVAISGTPWNGHPVQLQHADVVVVRHHTWQLFSLPLSSLEQRVEDVSAMILHRIGPSPRRPVQTVSSNGETLQWTPDEDFESFFLHWRLVQLSWRMAIGADGEYQKCVIVAKDIPSFVVRSGTRWVPRDHESTSGTLLTSLRSLELGDGVTVALHTGTSVSFLIVNLIPPASGPGLCLAGVVDVILAARDGSDLADWPCPEGWSLRPVHTLGPIGHAAMQRATAPVPVLFHKDPPDGPLIEIEDEDDDSSEVEIVATAVNEPGLLADPPTFPAPGDDIWGIPDVNAEIDLDLLLERLLALEPEDDVRHGQMLLQTKAVTTRASDVARVRAFIPLMGDWSVTVSLSATFEEVRRAFGHICPLPDNCAFLPLFPPHATETWCLVTDADMLGMALCRLPFVFRAPGTRRISYMLCRLAQDF